MTRTSRVGYLRDIRRLTVALSRARLGLYILGRRDVFEACYELRPAFEILLQRPDKLALSTGEMWPSNRNVQQATELPDAAAAAETTTPAQGQEAVMEGVEHLGQFVFEMTSVRARQMRAERGLLPEEADGQGQGQGQGMLEPVREEDVDDRGEGSASLGFVVPDDEEEDGEGDDNDADEDGDVDVGVDADVGEEEDRERTVGEGFEAEEN